MKTFEMSAQSGKVQMHYEAEERLTAKQKTTLGLAGIGGVVVLGLTYMAGIWALVLCAGAGILGGFIFSMSRDF